MVKAKTCNCPGGTSWDGVDNGTNCPPKDDLGNVHIGCQSCETNNGFHLNDLEYVHGKCVKCVCTGGVVGTGDKCLDTGTEACTSCTTRGALNTIDHPFGLCT